GFLQRRFVRLERRRAHFGRCHRCKRIVRWNDDVGRLVITTRLCDHAFHFKHAVIGINHGVTASRLSGNSYEVPEIAVSKSVMHRLAQALVLIRRHTHDVVNERALGFRAHHSIDCRQLAHCISRRQHCRAPSARVTIGSVGRVQFIRATNPLDVWIAIDCVTDGKGVVPRHAETVLDALISNSLDDVINYRHRLISRVSHHLFLKLLRDDISEYLKFFWPRRLLKCWSGSRCCRFWRWPRREAQRRYPLRSRPSEQRRPAPKSTQPSD